MNQATLLFPGERLQYHVVDYALDWARENEGSLNVIFLLPEHTPSEDYPFPNDLDQATILKESFDSEHGIEQILEQEKRYIQKRANARHIPVQFEIMYAPPLDELTERLKESDMLFIDKNIDEDPALFRDLAFTSEELRDKCGRLFAVGEYDRYSDVFY